MLFIKIYFCFCHFVLTFISNLYIIHFEIGKSRNVALSSLYTYDKEVMLMVEQTMLHIIILLFSALVAVTIIAIALIVVLAIIISK